MTLEPLNFDYLKLDKNGYPVLPNTKAIHPENLRLPYDCGIDLDTIVFNTSSIKPNPFLIKEQSNHNRM